MTLTPSQYEEKIEQLERTIRNLRRENREFEEYCGPLVFHVRNWIHAFADADSATPVQKATIVTDLFNHWETLDRYPRIRSLTYQGTRIFPVEETTDRFSILEF